MTVDKGEMYRYVLCEKPLFNETKKEKKNLRNICIIYLWHHYQIFSTSLESWNFFLNNFIRLAMSNNLF